MCPLKMDGPGHFAISRLATPDDRNPLSTSNPGRQYVDGFFDVLHVSEQMDNRDLFDIL